jgi:hypothetical protein
MEFNPLPLKPDTSMTSSRESDTNETISSDLQREKQVWGMRVTSDGMQIDANGMYPANAMGAIERSLELHSNVIEQGGERNPYSGMYHGFGSLVG